MKRKLVLFITVSLMVLGLTKLARPDATINVSNYVKGILCYQIGGNISASPTAPSWYQATNYDTVTRNLGMKLGRTGMSYGQLITPETLYPFKNGWQWNAASAQSSAQGCIANQADYFKRNNLAVLLLFGGEFEDAVSYPDRNINYDEAATFYAGIVGYYVYTLGVPVPYVELGNEMDLGGGMGMYQPNTGLYGRGLQTPYSGGCTPWMTNWVGSYGMDVSKEYIGLFQAIYNKVKAVSPTTKILGMAGSSMFTFQRAGALFQGNPRPDAMDIHIYPNTSPNCNFSGALTNEYMFTGFANNWGDWTSVPSRYLTTNWGYQATNSFMMISEWNYSGNAWNGCDRDVWNSIYYINGIAKMANTIGYEPSIFGSTYYSAMPGTWTDCLIDGPNALSSSGLGMRALSRYAGLDKRILMRSITTTDTYTPNGQGSPSPISFPRIDCIALRDNNTYKVLLVNSNPTITHTVTVNLKGLGLTNKPITGQKYYSAISFSNNTPKATNMSLVNGIFSIDVPPYGFAALSMPYSGIRLTNFVAAPTRITNSASHIVIFNAKVFSGAGFVTNVTIDLSQLNGPTKVKMSNISGATLYRYAYTVPSGIYPSVKNVPLTARDSGGNLNLGNSVDVTNIMAAAKIQITNLTAVPSILTNDVPRTVVFQLKAKDLQGGTITNVIVDLSQLNGNPYTRMSNISGNTIYQATYVVPAGLPPFTPKVEAIKAVSSFFATSDSSHSFTNVKIWLSHSIPGVIQAEDFDLGGEGVGYHTFNPLANKGGQYRTNTGDCGVNIYSEGTGYAVGNINSGMWLKYTTKVNLAGYYIFNMSVRDAVGTPSFHLEIDGVNVTGPIMATTIGWSTITLTNISITAGTHVLKMVFDNESGNLDFDWMSFVFQSAGLVMQANVSLSNVFLHGSPTGGKMLPGSTIQVRTWCTNPNSIPIVKACLSVPINQNVFVYLTNSSLNGLPAGWGAEWTTNANPSQAYLSPDYTGVICPAVQNVKWIRWKRTAGPMPANSSAQFRYGVIIR